MCNRQVKSVSDPGTSAHRAGAQTNWASRADYRVRHILSLPEVSNPSYTVENDKNTKKFLVLPKAVQTTSNLWG